MIDQISFVISTTAQIVSDPHRILEEASARHDGKIEELKQKLIVDKAIELHQFVLIVQSEKDILTAQILEDHGIVEKKILVDTAALCKQALQSEQEFARGFHVPLEFSLPNFGIADISPLISPLITIKPEQFTGPFFTAPCEVKNLTFVIQKLLEVAVLLSSSEKKALVQLRVERQGDQAISITISTNVPQIVMQKQSDIFVMYYGELTNNTNINLGSGLEGYLAKKIIESFNIPLLVNIEKTEEGQYQISFRLQIDKRNT